jgi:hypothetical protein
MKHTGYHAIRQAALRAYHETGDATAIVQIIKSADELYFSRDYSDWNSEDQVVFGMLTALSLLGDMSVSDIREHPIWQMCCALVGEKTVESLALLVWKEVK